MMRLYEISRDRNGTLHVLCSAQIKGSIVTEAPAGPFDIGNASKKTQALALAILRHYYGTDAGGEAEAQGKMQLFLEAFLIHHQMPPGARLEISGDVLDRWVFLMQIPISAR